MTEPQTPRTEPSPGGAPVHQNLAARGSGGLGAAFGHALSGLAEVAGERNMRLHLLAGVGVGLAGAELPLPLSSRLALHLCTALVIGAEAFNSALEALVDLQTTEVHPLARRAKDAAAGGVLVLAIGAVLVAGAVGLDAREAVAGALARPGWWWALLMDGALLVGLALLQCAVGSRWRPVLLIAIGLLLLAALARSSALSLTVQAVLLAALAIRATRGPVVH